MERISQMSVELISIHPCDDDLTYINTQTMSIGKYVTNNMD